MYICSVYLLNISDYIIIISALVFKDGLLLSLIQSLFFLLGKALPYLPMAMMPGDIIALCLGVGVPF